MDERKQLEQAIAAQESLRGTLDDAIIDAAIAALKEKLAALVPPHQQRKLATILFTDIVGSTQLTQGMDPEEQMALIDPLIARIAEKVDDYGGHVSRYQGDGFKAVFGLPVAHENDPAQAIRAGLAIQSESALIAEELKDFQVRVGITTGLIFAGGDTEGEDTIKGEPVNLAARLESAAAPGTVLISHDTYKHVRGIFDFVPLEPIEVKGFSDPVEVYRVLRVKTRPFYRGMRGVEGVETRMVGREPEFLQLQNIIGDVSEDRVGQMVTVVGEAGLGKSRMLYEYENWVDLQPKNVRLFKGRARLETQNLPYGLLRDLFAFQFSIQDNDIAQAVRDKVESGFEEIFGIGEEGEKRAHIIGQMLGYGFTDSPHLKELLENPQQLRDQAVKFLATYFVLMASQDMVLILLEDLHWADEASLDALNELAKDLSHQPVFILATARHSLLERRPHWGEGQDYHQHILLKPLSKRESRKLVAEVLQLVRDVPDALSELVVTNAEGNPFYVEELIKMLVEDGVIVRDDPQWRVDLGRLEDAHVPPTLTGVLQARLDGLPEEERRALQGASVVGRVFWDRILEHINDTLEDRITEREIEDVLDELRSRELIFRRETSAFAEAREHIFKHALLWEVTYESVLKRVRQAYHTLVAEWLIDHAGDRAGEFTGLIADHLNLAGKEKEAYGYLVRAGNEAASKYANEDAILFFERALELLNSQPDTIERARQELDILMSLGPSLIATRGYGAPEVEHVYARSQVLAKQTGQTDLLFNAMWGQWVHHNQICEFDTAKELIAQLFKLAKHAGEDDLLLEAHHSGWTTEGVLGNAIASEEHVKKGLDIYKSDLHDTHIQMYGHDPKVCAMNFSSFNLWLLGYPDQAHQQALIGLAHGKDLGHPFSLAFSLIGIMRMLLNRGEFMKAAKMAEEGLSVAEEHGFPLFIATSKMVLGSALVKEGNGAEGKNKILQAESMVESIGAKVIRTWILKEFLEACLATGDLKEGLESYELYRETHTFNGQRWLDPEIRRLHGELILANNPDQTLEAEKEFHSAIGIAQQQQVKSLELRAVMSLAHLWQQQGKIEQAHERLSEVYNWFTEGFDTKDLKDTKALLAELESMI